VKIGKNALKTDQPRLLDAAERAAKDEAVEALIRGAPSQAEAWESLGPRTKTEAEMARDKRVSDLTYALKERWLAVLRGRDLVEANGVQPGYRERFEELHTQRLELRWALEAEVFPHKAQEPDRLARLADEEVADALGGVWPSEAVQAALRMVSWAVATEGSGAVREQAIAAVAAACEQVYSTPEETV
jgi:hypothetical protein